jgi:L-asparaginase
VHRGHVEPLAPPPPRPPATPGEPESDVALIKAYPGIEPALLTAVADAGARGVVLEGTGRGNVPVGLFTAISELTDGDIPVAVASRCHRGAAPLEDTPLDIGLATKVGAIGARGPAPSKARVALMAALGDGGGVRTARAWFAEL